MKKKRWIDALVLISILVVSVVARVIYISNFMKGITVSDSLIQRVWMPESNLLSGFEFTLDDIYSVCLSYAMLFFGNKAIVGVGVNVVLQLLSILFIYLCIRTVSDRTAATIPTIIIAILPVYVTMVSDISSFALLLAGVAFLILVSLTLIKAIVTGIYKLTHRDESEDEETEDDQPEMETNYLSEEELSAEESYDEDNDETDDDVEEPVEYLENIGYDWEMVSENDMITEQELGALISKKESTLFELDRLEEKYQQEEMSASDETSQTESQFEQNGKTEEEITEQPEQENEMVSDESEQEETLQEESSQTEQPKDEPGRRERDTSFDDELDFTRYDIEDMSGMDFFDIE